jgi:NAD(P)H-quinone oxidoreductase subunit 5
LANNFAALIHFGKVAEFEGMNGLVMIISTAAALAGFILAWLVYQKRTVHINSAIATTKQPLIKFLYDFSYNKWKFDEFYLGLVNRVLLPLFNGSWQLIDKLLIDNLVNFTGIATLATGSTLRYMQNGRGQYYALVIFACVAGFTIAAYLLRP